MIDVKAVAAEVIRAMRDHIKSAIAPVLERVVAVEQVLAALPQPRDGKDADPEVIRTEVARAVEALPKPKDGKDGDSVDMVELSGMIAAAAAKAVAAIPLPKDGRDFDPELLEAAVLRAVAALPKPENGKDADPAFVAGLVAAEVAKAVAQIRVPEDGKDADQNVVRQLVTTEVERAVAALPPPQLPADAIRVAAEEAAAALPRAEKGEPGRDADPEMVLDAVAKAVAAMPRPKDGESVPADLVQRMVDEAVAKAVAAVRMPVDGEPGRDAAQLDVLDGLDDTKAYPRGTFAAYRGGMVRSFRATDPLQGVDGLEKAGWSVVLNGVYSEEEVASDEGRTITRTTVYTSGKSLVREHKTSAVIYRGVWREGQEYSAGDSTTRDGTTWILRGEQRGKPGDDGSGWQMSVKKGRDGLKGDKGDRGAAAAPKSE